jgi:hypothetical protein
LRSAVPNWLTGTANAAEAEVGRVAVHVTVIGWPERASSIQLSRQLPRIQEAAPSLRQRLPRPKGSSTFIKDAGPP